MKLKELLGHHLDHTFEKESTQPSLAAAVQGLTAAQAAWQPSPRRHSIWQIVRHVTLWKEGAIAALDGRPVDYDEWNRRDWAEAEGDQTAWERDVARLHRVSGELRARLAAIEEEELTRRIAWYARSAPPRPIATRFLELATHDAYHAGQIQYLFALQEIPVEELTAAASRDDIDRLAQVLERHPAAVRGYTREGWTALHVACYFGMAEAVRLLLERGAAPDAVSRNDERHTPLHMAAGGIANRAEIATMLLASGAAAGIEDASGRTPLDIARKAGREDVADRLERERR